MPDEVVVDVEDTDETTDVADSSTSIESDASEPMNAETEQKSGEKTHTQREVGKLLAAERERVKKQYEDYDDIKGRNGVLSDENERLKLDKLRLEVAIEKQLPLKIALRLEGDSREALEKDADDVRGLLKPSGASFDGGVREQAATAPSMATFLGDALNKR